MRLIVVVGECDWAEDWYVELLARRELYSKQCRMRHGCDTKVRIENFVHHKTLHNLML